MPRVPKPRWSKSRRRWYACIGDLGPDRRAKEAFAPATISEKEEGKAWEWFHAEVASRQSVEVPPGSLTVEDLCEMYLLWAEGRIADGKLSRVHYANKEHHLTKLADFAGSRPADAMTAELMNDFVEMIRAVHAPNYVANICSTCSAAFNWAVRAKHLPSSPIAGYEVPAVPRAPERFAERAEAAAFLAHWRTRSDRSTVAGRYDRLTLLLERCLIRTGARPGEMCRLRWGDFRWDAGRTSAGLAYARAVIPARREDGTLGHKTGDKTGQARTIYFTPALTRALRREMARPGRHPESVFVHGRGRGGKGAGEPWASGSRLSKKILAVRRELIARQEAAKLGPYVVRPSEAALSAIPILDVGDNRVTNYRWRHTAASTLLMMGVDVPTVAELLGTSPAMLYRVYGHLLDGHLSDASEKLQGKLNIKRGGSKPAHG